MEILSGIVLIGLVALWWPVMRYNMHMFQLNSYTEEEHINWFKEKHGKQRLLLVVLVLGLLLLPGFIVPAILLIPVILIGLKYFWYLKKTRDKKPLVFTARVKRMVGTDIAICGIPVFIVALFSLPVAAGIAAILTAAQPGLVLLCNRLMMPVEKSVRNHYIKDAKSILRQHPELTIIGVTGSYGKTSVKFYLETLLQTHFNTLVTPESYNTPMGVVITIRTMLKSTHEIFVCEMGAKCEGEIEEICDIVKPHHGVITSIGPAHLETFHSMENIVKTKFELADNLRPKGLLFLNGDNDYIADKAWQYPENIMYRTGEGEGYRATDMKLSEKGTEFTVTSPEGETEVFRTRLVGAHNVINIVGAIAVAHEMGIPLADLRVSVRRLKPAPHRMEILNKGPVTILDDSFNSNPIGSKAAVETLNMFDGTRILVTPGMVELGEEEDEYNYKFGTYAAENCDYILLVGLYRTEPIRKGAIDAGFPEDKVKTFAKLGEAMEFAYSIRDEGQKYILLENDLPDNY